MPKKINAKVDLNDEAGPSEASGLTTEANAGGAARRADNDVLEAIASLHSELSQRFVRKLKLRSQTLTLH